MDLSLEMLRYTTTGQCPYCHVVILSPEHMSKYREQLQGVARHFSEDLERQAAELDRLDSIDDSQMGFLDKLRMLGKVGKVLMTTWNHPILAPSESHVIMGTDGTMECTTCHGEWSIGLRPIASHSEGPAAPNLPLTPSAASKTVPSAALRKVDLSGCEILGVTGEKPVEVVIEETRKKYRNNSNTTVTREISISTSVTRAVTTDSSQLKSYNTDAGITIFGFATIQGHVQQQLSHRYSVMLQNTLSVSEKSSVVIQPHSAIEHVIQWKVVSWSGTALLGEPAQVHPQPVAQIPYEVPFRLTYEDDFFDIRA